MSAANLAGNKSSLSDLSSWQYDAVVGVTQEGLNIQLLDWEHGRDNKEFYAMWTETTPNQLQYQTFSWVMNNTDQGNPLAVVNGVYPTAQQTTLFKQVGFKYGMKARVGIKRDMPNTINPFSLISFGDDLATVHYQPVFDEFQFVSYDSQQNKWTVWVQTDKEPWLLTSTFNIYTQTTSSGSDLNLLGSGVQNRAKELQQQGFSSFSVQSLILKLTSASDNYTINVLPNDPSADGLRKALTQVAPDIFRQMFLQTEQSQEKALLSVFTNSGPSSSDIPVTSCKWMINPYNNKYGLVQLRPNENQSRQATFNYLCGINNSNLPRQILFNWNWVSGAAVDQIHGAAAISRYVMCDWIWSQIKNQVLNACYNYSYDGHSFDAGGRYYTLAPQLVVQGNNSFWVDKLQEPSSGSPVLNFSFDYSQYNNHYDSTANDTNSYTCTVEFSYMLEFDNGIEQKIPLIIITQHALVHADYTFYGPSYSGNTVDWTCCDTYTIAIDANGNLTWHKKTDMKNNAPDMSVLPVVQAMDSGEHPVNYASAAKPTLQNLQSMNFDTSSSPNIALLRNFFPGSGTFSFSNTRWSDNLDLLTDLTYRSSNII